MQGYTFDIETDGLLHEVTKVHCLVLKNRTTGNIIRCASGHHPIEYGLKLMAEADYLVAHNGIGYDHPALKMLFPKFSIDLKKIKDTLVEARLRYPDIKAHDHMHIWPMPPGKLSGKHSLKAWGYRIGELKGDFAETTDWKEFTPEMLEYCVQDVEVCDKLYDVLQRTEVSPESRELEYDVAEIIARQERHGFAFNRQAAADLYSTLVKERDVLKAECNKVFTPWYADKGLFTPKKDDSFNKPPKVNKKTKEVTPVKHGKGFGVGATFTRIALVEFNPASRDHIAARLISLHGWEPRKFTQTGKPQIDETVLEEMPWPEAKVLTRYFVVNKIIGYVAEGDNAWLKLEQNGRMHGGVNANGAVTGRMTHFKPNMGQIPANHSPFGPECRGLFGSSPGRKLVGTDADALELRCMASYMARYDGGEYIKVVLEGKKSDGTDSHSRNARALSFTISFQPQRAKPGQPQPKTREPIVVKCSRDDAKTWFYAFIYGAGDHKLGTILGYYGKTAELVGKFSRERILKSLPALKRLVDAIKERVKKFGYLIGLDGRKLFVRSAHSALNTLLQAAGAIVMKKALVILDKSLQAIGLRPGRDYEFSANVHDEWQKDCVPSCVEEVKRFAILAIRQAGEHFKFKCPLDGQATVGLTWAETH